MQDLPYEIWHLISSHLPDEDVKSLYPVNRALFNISMNLRYQTVGLTTCPKTDLEQNDIRFFANPFLAPRPKAFRVYLCFYFAEAKTIKNFFLKQLRQPFVGSKKRHERSSINFAELVEIIADVVPRLTGVTALEFLTLSCCARRPSPCYELDYSKVEKLVLPILQNLRNQVRILGIACALKYLEGFLSKSPRMQVLESLVLQTYSTNPEEINKKVISRRLVPFLTEHQSLLRNFDFRIDNEDYLPILLCLSKMRRLQSIRLFLPPREMSFEDLERHVSTGHQAVARNASVKSLTLFFDYEISPSYWPDPWFFSQDWCSIEFPCLTELRVEVPWMSFFPGLADYTHRFAASLVSLSIYSPIFDDEAITELCSRLLDFHSLRHLTLSILYLNPTHLIQFAHTLPHLQTLALVCCYLFPNADNRNFEPLEFSSLYCQKLQEDAQILSDWKLEWLIINPETDDIPDSRVSWVLLSLILLKALPNMQKFCGMRRDKVDVFYARVFGDVNVIITPSRVLESEVLYNMSRL